ncbi:MAG: hypothetical protein MJ054_02380, partial [Clostridia bacterium]|nr:hypothetical protein [Clostridia bacterium]
MNKSRKILLCTLLGATCLTNGCVWDKKQDDKYPFQYLITDSKVMELEDQEASEGSKRLYVRAWDCENSTQKDGYYGLQKAGEYTYNNFIDAFNPDTKKFSYEPIADSTAALCRTAWKTELDEFFQNNEDEDVNYVVLSCIGDSNGNLKIFDDFLDGTKYTHDVSFETVINWFKDYKGKFYFILSAAYGGRWLRSDYAISFSLLKTLNQNQD